MTKYLLTALLVLFYVFCWASNSDLQNIQQNGHTYLPEGAQISDNGKFFATWDSYNLILHQTSNGLILNTVSFAPFSIEKLTLDKDCSKIAILLSDCSLYLWFPFQNNSYSTKGTVHSLIKSFSFINNSDEILLGLNDGKIFFWKYAEKTIRLTKEISKYQIDALRLSDDGKYLLAVDSTVTLYFYSVQQNKTIYKVNRETKNNGNINTVLEFNQDDKVKKNYWVDISGEHTYERLFWCPTEEPKLVEWYKISYYNKHEYIESRIHSSIGSDNTTGKDTVKENLEYTSKSEYSDIGIISIAPLDTDIIYFTDDGRLIKRHKTNNYESSSVDFFKGLFPQTYSASISKDGLIGIVLDESNISIYDLAKFGNNTQKDLPTLLTYNTMSTSGWIYDVCYSNDGEKIYISNSLKQIHAWDVIKNTPDENFNFRFKEISESTFESQSINTILTTKDNNLLLGSVYSSFHNIDLNTGNSIYGLFDDNNRGSVNISYNSEQNLAAISFGNNNTEVWDIKNQKKIGVYQIPQIVPRNHYIWMSDERERDPRSHTEVSPVALSHNGKYIVIGNIQINDATVPRGMSKLNDVETDIFLFQLNSDKPSITFHGHKTYITDLVLSPDDKYMVSCDLYGSIIIWDTQTGKLLKEINVVYETYPVEVTALHFSKDGTIIFAGCVDCSIRAFDIITGAPLYQLNGHTGSVSCLDISPDGSYMVSGSFDGSVKVWDLLTRKLKKTLFAFE